MKAWIREAHPAAKGNTGDVTLVNGGSEEVTLTGVQSPSLQERRDLRDGEG
ncbi:MAG: copper(I)-binding protein [Paracoccaceae bacterium]|jgi:copper(I)-binding protein